MNLRAENRYDPERRSVGVFWVVTCSKCGSEGAIRRTSMKNTREGAEERVIAERLRREGWETGNNLKNPVCPTCVQARDQRHREARDKVRVLFAVETPPKQEQAMTEKSVATLPMKADPPRQPTPPDRRRIVAKMDEAYDTRACGYLKGFSDEKVAETLAVPLAWVRDIREMMYGPAIPAEVAVLQPEVRRLEMRIKDAEALLQRAIADIATMKADLSALRSKVGMADAAA